MSEHPYVHDPKSGAGNCWCGAAERHARHPHGFMKAASAEPRGSATLCTCSKPLSDPIHRVARETVDV